VSPYLGDDPFSLLVEAATAVDAADKERCLEVAQRLTASEPKGVFTWLPAAAAYKAGRSMEFEACWRRAQISQYAEWLARKMPRKPEIDPALDVCLVTAAKAYVDANGLRGSQENVNVPPRGGGRSDVGTWPTTLSQPRSPELRPCGSRRSAFRYAQAERSPALVGRLGGQPRSAGRSVGDTDYLVVRS